MSRRTKVVEEIEEAREEVELSELEKLEVEYQEARDRLFAARLRAGL